MRIPLAKTDTGSEELAAVTRVMQSGRLASGPEITAFETEFAAYLGVKHAVMTNSGTAALVTVLRACGIRPGDEVIMPSLTFVATVNAVLQCGAIPVLTDVNDSALIEADKVQLAISDKTRAIIPVDLYGQCADVREIRLLAEQASKSSGGGDGRILVIEDAAEALGAGLQNHLAGSLNDGAGAHAAIFGFYPNKLVTTGEGGMIAINDPVAERHCRGLINQGRSGGTFDPAAIPGFSARGTEMSAATGRVQLRSLTRRLGERQKTAILYLDVLLSRGLRPLIQPLSTANAGTAISWFTMPIILPAAVDRDQLMAGLAGRGIETADYFPAIHTLEVFAPLVRTAGDLATSCELGQRLLCLPFWPGIEPWIEEIADEVALSLTL